MKVITWNLERLEKLKPQQAKEILLAYNAEIYVLTETHENMSLGEDYKILSSKSLYSGHDGMKDYKTGECRTQIFSKYNILEQKQTFDEYNTLHLIVETPQGNLTIYGGIIGIDGGTTKNFKRDLEGVLKDWSALNKEDNICLAGDFNTILQGHKWPSKVAVDSLNTAFKKLNMTNLTMGIPLSVDHIVLSNGLLDKKPIRIETWNADKKLSDHIGISVEVR